MAKQHGQPNNRKLRYTDYVLAITIGELVTRRDMQKRMGDSYSATLYNLESAVTAGALKKVWCFVNGNQPGWAYGRPSTIDAQFVPLPLEV